MKIWWNVSEGAEYANVCRDDGATLAIETQWSVPFVATAPVPCAEVSVAAVPHRHSNSTPQGSRDRKVIGPSTWGAHCMRNDLITAA